MLSCLAVGMHRHSQRFLLPEEALQLSSTVQEGNEKEKVSNGSQMVSACVSCKAFFPYQQSSDRYLCTRSESREGRRKLFLQGQAS